MLVYIWLYTQNTIKCLFWIQTLPFLIENLKDSAKTPKNWTFRSSVTAEKILLKFPLPAPSACSHQGSRRSWQHPPASCHHQGPLRATEQLTGGTLRGKGQNIPNIQPRCAGRGKARPGSTGFTNTEHPLPLTPVPGFPSLSWIIINIHKVFLMKMSHHHPLFAQSHIPNSAFHSSLPSQGTAHQLSTELKVSKKNRSSTEVESFKELNLSYTINLYIPGMTNSQQQVHGLGCLSSWRYHTARGISCRSARLGLGPQLKWSGLATPAWSLTENQQPVAHVLDLTSLTSLWRNEEWMIKAWQKNPSVYVHKH